MKEQNMMRARNWSCCLGAALCLAITGCGDSDDEDQSGLYRAQMPTILSMGLGGAPGNGDSQNAQISGNGRYVVFESDASNLVAGDTNSVRDIFVVDLKTGSMSRASTAADGSQANGKSLEASISTDGLTVAFTSDATNLVAGDENGVRDAFVKNLLTGSIERLAPDPAFPSYFGAFDVKIAADGRHVVFISDFNAWVKDLRTGRLKLASVNSSGVDSKFWIEDCAVSADGRWVLFISFATDLVEGDSHENRDLFLKDMESGTLVRVSTNALGQENSEDNAEAFLSADGRQVLFTTWAQNMVPGFSGSTIVLKDLATGAIGLVTASAGGKPADLGGRDGSLSADGRYAVFSSQSTNLVPGDDVSRLYIDVYVKDLQTGAIVRIDDQSVHGSNTYYSRSNQPSFSANSNWLVLHSHYDAIAADDKNGFADVILMRNPFRPR
jgi:hypothetical protein